MILANGLKYPPFPEWREPTATVVVREIKGKQERLVLRSSLDRASWRELHALTVKMAQDHSASSGPFSLQNISGDKPFDLWVGGLVSDQAKVLDTTESVFHVPAAMLTEPSQRAYEGGVRFAQDVEFRLCRAISTYHRELGDNLDRPEMRTRRQQIQQRATFQFWTAIERRVGDLLAVAENPSLLGLDSDWNKTDWGKAVSRASLDAFKSACPHETARQMRAYALGRRAIFAVSWTSQS